MAMKVYLSNEFKSNMGSISKELGNDQTPVYVFNAMDVKRSFFAVPENLYFSILPDIIEEKKDLMSMVSKLKDQVTQKYKDMVRKRYEKGTNSEKK